MQACANAWASRDVTALRALPHEDHNISCFDAILNSSFGAHIVSDSGLTDVESQLKRQWLATAENALQKNSVTFAMLPIENLLESDGLVAYFRGKGYQVRGG
jgi:hypothetical protein